MFRYSIKDVVGREIKQLNFPKEGGTIRVIISWDEPDTDLQFYPYNAEWEDTCDWVTYGYEDISRRFNMTTYSLDITAQPNESEEERTYDRYLILVQPTNAEMGEVVEYYLTFKQEGKTTEDDKPRIVTNWEDDTVYLEYGNTTLPTDKTLEISVKNTKFPPSSISVSPTQGTMWVNNIIQVGRNLFSFSCSQNYGQTRYGRLQVIVNFEFGDTLTKELTVVQYSQPNSEYFTLLNTIDTVGFERANYTIAFEHEIHVLNSNTLAVSCLQGNVTCSIRDKKYIDFTTSVNNTNNPRNIVLKLSCQDTHGTVYVYFIYITQLAMPTYYSIQSDIDTFIQLQMDGTQFNYQIKDGDTNELLFVGKGYVENGFTNIYINNILNKFMQPRLDIFGDTNTHGYKWFQLCDKDGGLISNIYYKYVWEYYNYELNSTITNRPILDEIAIGQYLPMSYLSTYDNPLDTITVSYKRNGTEFRKETYTTEYGTHSTLTETNSLRDGDIIEVKMGGTVFNTYKVKQECGNNLFAIIYRNLRGGFDTVIFHSRLNKQTDKISNNLWERFANNQEILHERQNSSKQITETWNLKTRWLKDEEAARMKDLLLSNEVYLYRLDNNTNIIPINITNTSFDYKNRMNNNNKLISYTITCESARNKYSN